MMRPISSKSSTAKAFTLIELLVVIGIIAILMGLLFPAISSAIKSAKKTAARNDVVQIATAVNNFMAEYGRFPAGLSGGSSQVSGTFLNSLMGSNASDNPRGIVFLDIPVAKKGKSGYSNGVGYVDPWGTNYMIAVDTANYTGPVTALGGQSVNGPVAVWMQTNKDVTTNVPTSW